MSDTSRLPAVLAYLIPFIGWLYVLLFARKNEVAMYHLKQAIGLFLFLLGMLLGWGVVAWLLAWLPYMAALGVGLFTLVIAAYLYGVVAWIMGLANALRNRLTPLPGFGRWAERLPLG